MNFTLRDALMAAFLPAAGCGVLLHAARDAFQNSNFTLFFYISIRF